MLPDGRIEVATLYERPTSPVFGSIPLVMGAEGQAVAIEAVHYSIDFMDEAFNAYLAIALSSNPAHELIPPATIDDMHSNKALYGFSSMFRPFDLVSQGASSTLVNSRIIPLYGVIRPRRQILVYYWLHQSHQTRIRVEVFYQVVSLTINELDTLDRKYGKYRRT